MDSLFIVLSPRDFILNLYLTILQLEAKNNPIRDPNQLFSFYSESFYWVDIRRGAMYRTTWNKL